MDLRPHPRSDARGYLTDTLSWRAIFYINLPLGIIGVALAATVMGADLSDRRPRRLDLLGLVTMATGVITLLLALSQGNREGWNSQYIVWLFVIAAVSLLLFVLIELWVGDPLVDLRLYRNATYSMATLVGVLLGFAMYSSLLLPLFLEDFLAYTALQAAIIMLPGVVLTGAISPLVGKWTDQCNPRLFLVLGLWRRRPPIGLLYGCANRGERWSGRSLRGGPGSSSRPSSC